MVVTKKRKGRNNPVKNEIKVRQINENKFLDPRYRTSPRYTFLQHIRVALRWATRNYDISRPHVEMVLYFYGVGVFKPRDFHSYCKIIQINSDDILKFMLDSGWFIIWRDDKNARSKLYVLSDKAKRMCDTLHKICTGETLIPESPRSNFMIGKENPRIDGYYMDIIKQMNKKVREGRKKE